ncbi:MAG: HypC/HybG/HupF family hydrogenase formation chaperone [Nitrospinae bacterium]|nr:HypC/HybG/HupF family hydrogenase formation chaperone [Nitrospinota bacterium]
MCLAVPGKVISIYEEGGMKMGRVDFGGTVKTACLEYVPEIQIGQYTIVHAGFALSIINEEEAIKTLEIFDGLAAAAADD